MLRDAITAVLAGPWCVHAGYWQQTRCSQQHRCTVAAHKMATARKFWWQDAHSTALVWRDITVASVACADTLLKTTNYCLIKLQITYACWIVMGPAGSAMAIIASLLCPLDSSCAENFVA